MHSKKIFFRECGGGGCRDKLFKCFFLVVPYAKRVWSLQNKMTAETSDGGVPLYNRKEVLLEK